MSLHYILDGYNVIKRVDMFSAGKLQSSREMLIKYIEDNRLQGSPRNKITVVFDGKEDVIGYKMDSTVQVIFTRGKSADEKIKEMVENASDPGRIVVVSEDKGITYYCRSFGAKIKSVEGFLNKRVSAYKRKKKQFYYDGIIRPSLSSEQARLITEELKEIWLKEDEQSE